MAGTAPKSYSLSVLRGLTARETAHLKKEGIRTTRQLVEVTAKGTRAEHALAEKVGMTFDRMREAVNRSDLLQVPGIGPSMADLLENTGVNSTRELSHRSPASLTKKLAAYVKGHPELNFRAPGPKTVANLVARARKLIGSASSQPITSIDQAKISAAVTLHDYIDQVLFSDDPAGAHFRTAILEWRPESEWPQVQQQMHEEVDSFLNGSDAELQKEESDQFIFVGRLLELYTEVKVPRTGGGGTVYLEID